MTTRIFILSAICDGLTIFQLRNHDVGITLVVYEN